ncbi:MAG: WYL domain-containing protein [Pseudomonadota bacterium]
MSASAERFLSLILKLKNSRVGYSLEQLSSNYQCSEKTIRRYLTAIGDVGFDLNKIKNDEGTICWFIDRKKFEDVPISFTKDELSSLYLATDYFRGSVFSKSMGSAFDKIKNNLTDKQREYVEELGELLYTSSNPGIDYSKSYNKIEDIKEAIINKKKLRIKYKSHSDEAYINESHIDSRPKFRIIDPFQIYTHDNILYLVANCNERKAKRTFAIHRIISCEIQDQTFKVDKNFSLADYLAEGFNSYRGEEESIKYKIWFDKTVAAYVKDRKWHRTQKEKDLKNRDVIITFKSRGKKAVKRWVMGYGDKAKILEPKEIATEIKDEISNILKLYGKDSS